MKFVSLCEQYKEALGAKDLAAVQVLFTEDAVISAPISGTANVRDFHIYLFLNTKKTAVRFPNVIRRRENPPTFSMQFSYTLAIETGQVTVLDGVAIFEIDASVRKFKKLTVAYDSSDVRQLMMEAGIAPPETSVATINAS